MNTFWKDFTVKLEVPLYYLNFGNCLRFNFWDQIENIDSPVIFNFINELTELLFSEKLYIIRQYSKGFHIDCIKKYIGHGFRIISKNTTKTYLDVDYFSEYNINALYEVDKSKIDITKLLKRIFNAKFDSQFFLVNYDKNIVLNIYDDSGCDLLIYDKNLRKLIYDKYSKWIINDERENILNFLI